jgi:hypothetical protein
VKTICDVLDVPRSTFYHPTAAAEDGVLRAALLDLVGQYPTYGYRRLTALLKRAGWTANHKRIQRIMTEMGLQLTVTSWIWRSSWTCSPVVCAAGI